MFESAEVDGRLSKDEFAKQLPEVRAALLEAQHKLARSGHSLLVLVGGDAAAGKGELVDTLLAWMDARGIHVHTFLARSPEERSYPGWWRYWQAMPRTGRAAIFFGSWYTQPIAKHAGGKLKAAALDGELRRIVELERMLASERVIVFKVWLHLSRKAQKKRIEKLKATPLGRAHLTPRELHDARHYQSFRDSAEHALRLTSTAEAPWLIVNAAHPRHRNLTVARALTLRLEQTAKSDSLRRPHSHKAPALPTAAAHSLLSELDLTKTLEDSDAAEQTAALQARLALAALKLHRSKRSAILLFEGPDAAGKGGVIRRLTDAMDARIYQVRSVSAPTDEEAARPYLWRFWRDLPARSRMTIYDRSWYGRVLVERLEGFATESEWTRAYGEINAFEEELTEAGAIILKFWIAISPKEQLRRFKSREGTPYKQYKLTKEDWRNREKWDAYSAAACDMFEKTSTENAKWSLIAGDDKRWARVQILKTAVRALERAVGAG